VALANALLFTYSAWRGDRDFFFWSFLIP
jgi:hypothetical protein